MICVHSYEITKWGNNMTNYSEDEPILKYEHVDISYAGKKVVSDVSFTLHKGEIMGLVGESGSGKSTIIKAAMNLLGDDGLVTRGDIWYKNLDLPDVKGEELRKLCGPDLAMIFQNAGLSMCPIRKIGDQIYESMNEHEKISKEEFLTRVEKIMGIVGLTDYDRILDSYPFQLSGGMNQRIGICMAMLLNPKVLLADEPTSALDVTTQKKVVEEMLKMRDEYGTSMIIVTHNIGLVEKMCDTVAVLKDGMIKEFGHAKDVINNPQDEYTKLLMKSVIRIKKKA